MCHQTPRGNLGPAQEGGQWAPWEQGLGPSWGLWGMRGCRGGSLVPSPMTLRGPRAVWAAGCMDEVQPLAVMGPPQDESPEHSGWGSCAYPRLHITVQETSCLLGTRAESPCSLLVKGPHLGRHRMLGAAPPCPRQSEWRAPLLQEAMDASTHPALAPRPPHGRLVMVAGQASPPGRLLHPTALAGRVGMTSVLL